MTELFHFYVRRAARLPGVLVALFSRDRDVLLLPMIERPDFKAVLDALDRARREAEEGARAAIIQMKRRGDPSWL